MAPAAFDSELGAFVDELCADLCRFECAAATGCAPADVGVEREVTLAPEIHADLRVEPPGGEPFFVENKLAYVPADLVDRIRRKYGATRDAWRGARRIAVVRDGATADAELTRALRAAPAEGLAVEIWEVADLLARLRATFGAEVSIWPLASWARPGRARSW